MTHALRLKPRPLVLPERCQECSRELLPEDGEPHFYHREGCPRRYNAKQVIPCDCDGYVHLKCCPITECQQLWRQKRQQFLEEIVRESEAMGLYDLPQHEAIGARITLKQEGP